MISVKNKIGLRRNEKVDLNFLFILCMDIFSIKKPVFRQKNAFIYKKNFNSVRVS